MKTRKIISLLLAAAVSVSMLALPALAESSDSNSDFTITNGVLTKYDGSGGDVIIPDGVKSIGDGVFEDNQRLTSIVIPGSVTSIGKSAFDGCIELTSVTIPGSVTSIGNMAFDDCTSLSSISVDANNQDYLSENGILFNKNKSELIQYPAGLTQAAYTIPGSVTSIGEDAFASCADLASVTISDSVGLIGDGAFANCSNLSEISVDSGNPNYSSEGGVLFDKNRTKLIQYPGGKAETAYTVPDTVANIGDDAFVFCKGLTSIVIPSSVTSIGSEAFEFAENLTSINIPNSVTSIGDSVFEYCTGLTSITIPGGVTSIGKYEFAGCVKLASVTIQKGVKNIGKNALSNCTSLVSIAIPSSVTSIGSSVFSYCTSLCEISVDSGNPNYSSMDGLLFNKDKTKLILYPQGRKQNSYTIPNGVTGIGYFAFASCSALASVTIPGNVKSIGEEAFAGCSNLSSVTLQNGVTSIGKAAFGNCEKLTSMTIPSSVTSIGDGAFVECGGTLFTTGNFIIYGTAGSYAQTYANKNKIPFNGPALAFGTVKYSTIKQTNGNVTVTIPVTGATVSSVTHTFTANGSYTFTITDTAGNTASKTVTIGIIDKKKPIIKVSIGNGKKTKGKVIVTVTDSNLEDKSVKLNGKEIAWPQKNTFTAKGKYVVTATDFAGNISKATFSIVK